MAAQTTNLFLLEDLEDSSKTRDLAVSDLRALRAIADWIKTFVIKPHKDLGRAGTVCPFVPGSLERDLQLELPTIPIARAVSVREGSGDQRLDVLFLNNDEWLNLWAHRFGASAVQALAEEPRRLPWNARCD